MAEAREEEPEREGGKVKGRTNADTRDAGLDARRVVVDGGFRAAPRAYDSRNPDPSSFSVTARGDNAATHDCGGVPVLQLVPCVPLSSADATLHQHVRPALYASCRIDSFWAPLTLGAPLIGMLRGLSDVCAQRAEAVGVGRPPSCNLGRDSFSWPPSELVGDDQWSSVFTSFTLTLTPASGAPSEVSCKSHYDEGDEAATATAVAWSCVVNFWELVKLLVGPSGAALMGAFAPGATVTAVETALDSAELGGLVPQLARCFAQTEGELRTRLSGGETAAAARPGSCDGALRARVAGGEARRLPLGANLMNFETDRHMVESLYAWRAGLPAGSVWQPGAPLPNFVRVAIIAQRRGQARAPASPRTLPERPAFSSPPPPAAAVAASRLSSPSL